LLSVALLRLHYHCACKAAKLYRPPDSARSLNVKDNYIYGQTWFDPEPGMIADSIAEQSESFRRKMSWKALENNYT
jgi:hypothetical protein